jgi:8-oxo-dGTP pyrophosphatase MutT (NUDIX family)
MIKRETYIKDLCRSQKRLTEHIRKRLKAHHHKQYIYIKTDWVDAAVLIPLFFKGGEAHLLFTKRTAFLKHHKGQISFPGGKIDPKDSGLKMTAIRETYEEIGLREDDIRILGKTDDFLTNTHFLVQPYVGFFPYPYNFNVNPAEIDRLIEVPLMHLLDDNNFEVKFIDYKGHLWPIHYYSYKGDIIWGVTGFLLSDFLNIVFDADKALFIKGQ